MAQTTYSLKPDAAQEGDFADIGANIYVRTYTNAQENVSQVTEGTVSANNGDAVGVKIDGVIVEVVSTASASGTATLLKDAINADPFVKEKVVATTDTATLILTFTDYESHTVTAYSPNTADVTGITNTTDAAAAEYMPFGRACVQSSKGDDFMRLPYTGTNSSGFLGVLSRSHAVAPELLPSTDEDAGLPTTQPGNVLRKGRMWVKVETAVTPASTVYFRHAAPGASPEAIGRFRANNDGGDATACPSGVRFLTSASAGSLAILEVNLP